MTFAEVMEKLNDFTARPKDGDWDEHTQAAMKAVYDLMQAKVVRYEKVVEAAKEMSQRLQTLPWFRSDGGEDAYHCLNHQVWKDWNYGECERLMNAVQELEHADER